MSCRWVVFSGCIADIILIFTKDFMLLSTLALGLPTLIEGRENVGCN